MKSQPFGKSRPKVTAEDFSKMSNEFSEITDENILR